MMTAKEIETLCDLLHKCGHHDENKKLFKKLGMKLARELAADLLLSKESHVVRYNEGGVAVSGDVDLHHEHFHLFFNAGVEWICARTCEGLKDSTGGRNRNYSYESLRREGVKGLSQWIRSEGLR